MTVPPPPGSTPPPPPPMPPGPGAQPPMGGPVTPTNGTATASMVLGILSLFCGGFLTGIPAIIMGLSGKKKAAEMNGVGAGQATAGIITGILGSVLSVIGIIIFIIAAASADSVVDDIENDYKKAVNETKEKSARNGDEADSDDYELTKEEVDVGSYGYVTYTAYIENKADFDTGYTIDVKCEGDKGDSNTETAYAYDLAEGDKDQITTYYNMDQDTSEVECEVVEVVYSY